MFNLNDLFLNGSITLQKKNENGIYEDVNINHINTNEVLKNIIEDINIKEMKKKKKKNKKK